MRLRHALFACLGAIASGCTGLSLGENMPGGDTWVEPDPPAEGEHTMGAIAVERDEDQLWVVHEEMRAGVIEGHLAAIDPVGGQTYEVMDVTGTGDRRVVFPADDRMILMAQAGGRDRLVLFDTASRQPLASVEKSTWYWGTRTSPSGRAVVVADNALPTAPLHVIDAATLGHQVIPHGGEAIEAMWNHHEDVLLAVSVSDPWGESPVARLLRYDLRDADLGAPLPAPEVKWELGGYDWDFWFSYTWIGISPDDHWAVFPLLKRLPDGEYEHVLLVLDQTTGGVELLPGSGPVGFTRDSSRIVSYGARPDGGGQDLWLIDPATGERKVVTPPFGGGISFAVARNADVIVCVSSIGDAYAPIGLYDVAADTMRAVTQPAGYFSLWDYVTRPAADELWLESGGTIYALSLGAGTLDPVPLGTMTASTINARPTSDQAVVGDGEAASIARVDMATRAVDGAVVALPSPIDADAAHSLRGTFTARRVSRVQSPFDPAYRAAAPEPRSGAIAAWR